MTPIIVQALLAAGQSSAASIIVKATATSAVALFIAHLASKRRASMLHVVFAAAFVTLLIIPIATMLLPPVGVPVSAHAEEGWSSGGVGAIDGGSPAQAPVVFREEAPRTSNLSISWNAVSLAVWVVTALIFLSPIVAGLYDLRQARRSAVPWPDGDRLVRQLMPSGNHRCIDVLLQESVAGPLTFGFVRPVIFFPADAPAWNAEDARRAMIHELEHIRRSDWLMHCIARSICALYWFHPLVWICWYRLRLAAERACDDVVLSAGEPIGYAGQLVTLAERLSPQSRRPLLAMAGRPELAARVTAVLNPDQRRGRTGRVCFTAVLASAFVLAVVISPLRAIPLSTTQATAATSESRLTFEVASIKPFSGRGPYGIQILPGGRVAGRGELYGIVAQAYGVPVRQVGGDLPVLHEFFAIEAKVPAGVFPDVLPTRRQDFEPILRRFQGMLQTLLADRFKLTIHKVTKELPVYALVVVKNSARLKPMPPDWGCEAAGAKCSFITGPARGLSGHMEISSLAAQLSNFVDRQIVDRTGLKGFFEIDLPPWNPTNPVGTHVRLDDNDEPQPSPNDASIFTVLQERLGLKLESTRAPMEVYVIDHIERPEPN